MNYYLVLAITLFCYMTGWFILSVVKKRNDIADTLKLSKSRLLQLLEQTERDLIEILATPDIGEKKVQVPWNNDPIPAIASLWGLDSHEILHTGWNLAVMDHLNIERFPALKKMWG